jgi:DNA polymerase III delta prime subunit
MSDSPRQIDSNWNMVGHTWAVDMLRQQVGRGEARQAYLFTGPPGTGRRTLALRFAQALNCETRARLPCGRATLYASGEGYWQSSSGIRSETGRRSPRSTNCPACAGKAQ